jgi:multidrug resistance efflux pump
MATNEHENTMGEEIKETVPKIEAQAKSRAPLMVAAAIVIILGGIIGSVAYIGVGNSRVAIDKADVEAPSVALSPTVSGTLMQVYVTPGQTVSPNTVVAEVGTELIKSTSGGLVTLTNNNIGAIINPGTAVVTMIDPTQLRVVGHLDENKGLAKVAVGDKAYFTVDAFGSRQFAGVVNEVSPTSNASDIVFSVSDKRQEQRFDIKVTYDISAYPELKNGMSARLWVYNK